MSDSIIPQIPTIIIDSVEYIQKSDVTAFYMDMMDKQANQFSIILTAIGIIFAIVVGATWWWNYKGAKQQINEEISTAKQSLNKLFNAHKKTTDLALKRYEENFNGFKGSLQKSINKQIEETIKNSFALKYEDFNNKVLDVDNKSKAQLDKMQEEVYNKLTSQQAKISRIFALFCTSSNRNLIAINWWIDALNCYAKILNDIWVGKSCDGLKALLEQIDDNQITEEDIPPSDFSNKIKLIESVVPLTRKSDKEYIIQRLKAINKRIQQIQEK